MSLETPMNISEHIEHCLTLLGAPVIRINVTEGQCRLVIKQAVKKFIDYHYAATANYWVSQEITPQIRDEQKFHVPDYIEHVTDILGIEGSNFNIMGDGNAQYTLWSHLNQNNMIYSGFGFDKVSLYLTQQNLSYYRNILHGPPPFTYEPHTKTVRIELPKSRLIEGQYIMYRANVNLMNVANSTFWSDDWLLRYSTALIQRQWGRNLGKFQDVEMPGGYKMNGASIESKAEAEIERLLTELYENTSASQTLIVVG